MASPLPFDKIDAARAGLFGMPRPRRRPTPARMARRRRLVAATKRLLPVVALGLLALVVLWPEISRDADQRRLSLQQGRLTSETGQMLDATYHSVDDHGRPYALTATGAHERRPGEIELLDPKADLTLAGGWLMVQASHGIYDQHASNIDMWGEVRLYRDDGTTMSTSSATLDLKSGAAAGSELVHIEGPFGTLDAQNFAVVDRGAVTQFSGPGRLLLNLGGR